MFQYYYSIVPITMLRVVAERVVSDTSYSLVLTPPLTAHPPQDLLLLTNLTPSHSRPLNLTFPSDPREVVTVTFTNLTAGVEYRYTVRVVLISDQSRDVVPQATGQFTIKQVGGK